ncbi:MAG: hypothetical protein JNL88_03560 [Bacteroidia bacterium]|nr:hypothetical protein [Bacteroidia bacterium]
MSLKFKMFFLVLLAGTMDALYACDMCGCFMGIQPGDRRSYAGVFYRYRSFAGSGVEGSAYFPDGSLKLQHSDHAGTPETEKAYEVYRGMEFRGRVYIHPRVELSVVAPYVMNTAFDGADTYSLNGFGDLTLLGGWQFIDELETGRFRHRLLLGAGLKLPTGNCDMQSSGMRHSIMMQCGTGSTDGLLYTNYQMGIGVFGLSLTPALKWNGRNRFGERVDRSMTGVASLFCSLKMSDQLSFMPAFQAYYEHTDGVFEEDVLIPGTEMNALLLGAGLETYYRDISISLSAMRRAYEVDSGSGLENKARLMLGFTWFFDQSAFIFKSRKSG